MMRLMMTAIMAMACLCSTAFAAELSIADFDFDGPLGSQGATIEKLATNHFKIVLGHAPTHPTWCNMLQFAIKQNAKGNRLRLDVYFHGGNDYRFNHYAHSSWSYDARNWHPIKWQKETKDSAKGDTLLFPEFTEDTVYFGHQVPMSYEDVAALMHKWQQHPHAEVHILGKSLEGRNIYRLTIADCRLRIGDSHHAEPAPANPKPPISNVQSRIPNFKSQISNLQSQIPDHQRWVHYITNQHPGEHNAQWRMVGMIDWLLSNAGADCRRRSISHFLLMMSPDAPSHGWYRVNAQGVDGNRSYFAGGADPDKQAHEAYIVQKDLEALMASSAPVTDLWSMHTWGGIVEPILLPGPEMGTQLPPWTRLRDIIEDNDPDNLIKPLTIRDKPGNPTYWNNGPHIQFGISTILCEGAGSIITKEENIASGAVLMKGLAAYYRGTKADSAPSVAMADFTVDPAWPRKPNHFTWGQMPGLAIDAADRVYLFTRSEPAVQVYRADGTFVRSWNTPGFEGAHGLRVDPEGNVWTTSITDHVVRKYSNRGKLLLTLGQVGQAGADESHFDKPTDMAILPSGDIFVSDGYGNRRIVHFDKTGKYVKQWGREGTARGEFACPHAIVADSRRRLYVADRENARIQVFDPTGKLLDLWTHRITPWGLHVTDDDEIWVCGSSPVRKEGSDQWQVTPPPDQIVIKLSTEGRILWGLALLATTASPAQPGRLNWVHAIATDAKGALYLADIQGQHAQKLVPRPWRLPARLRNNRR